MVETDLLSLDEEDHSIYRPAPQRRDDDDDDLTIAGRETKALRWVKLLFLIVVLISALMVALTVHLRLKVVQQNEFEQKVKDYGDKLVDTLDSRLLRTVAALHAVAYTAKGSWPYVTIPDFASRSAKFLSLSRSVWVGVVPFVEANDLGIWEDYAAQNNHWVKETSQFQQQFYTHLSKGVVPEYPHVFDDEEEMEKTTTNDLAGPSWQSFPLPTTKPAYNHNVLHSHIGAPVRYMLAKGNSKPICSRPMCSKLGTSETERKSELELEKWLGSFVGTKDEPSEPFSVLYHPVGEPVAQGEVPKGVMGSIFYWRDVVSDILPDTCTKDNECVSMVLVFKNACSASFAYKIEGRQVEFLGSGDPHDIRYDSLEQSVHLFANVEETNPDFGLMDFCQTTVHIYPHSNFEQVYQTSDPFTYSIFIVIIFLVTASVFIVYDICVERRQKVVLYSALKSATTVSMLEDKVQQRAQKLQETNRQLADANDAVVKASEAQLQHFACMSHEIRTPLNCIIGCSSLLKDTKLDPVQQETIQMISASGDLLLSVVNDVLDYSRLESGNVDIDPKRISLQEAMDSVILAMQPKAEERDIKLNTVFAMDLPEHVEADIRRLQQILYNLLSNAVKYSNEGGVVELQTLIKSSKQARSRRDTKFSPPNTAEPLQPLVLGQKYLRFVVTDYGKGIERENFEKIFKPFLQDSTSDSDRVYGGSGLGLTISTKLVHRMGGTISVDSRKGQWTEFTVEIPLVTEAPSLDNKFTLAKIKKTSVYLVCDKSETSRYLTSIFGCYQISVNKLSSLQAAKKSGSSSTHRIFIVAEDLFDEGAWNKVVGASSSSTSLLTFGPSFRVGPSDKHIRSIHQLLPIVFINQLAELVDMNGRRVKKTAGSNRSMTSATASSTLQAVPFSDFRILIAEDNIVNQKVLSRILNRLGADEVKIAGNGQIAVEMEAAEEFDFVLMDMQMPVMDGIEACEVIQKRDDRPHPRAKVIFVTAHATTDYEDDCLEAGAIDFLTKPCNLESVSRCFENVMRKLEAGDTRLL